MGIPLDQIITFEDNVYELTSIAILEAQKLAIEAGRNNVKSNEKLVSQALTRTMNNEVEIEKED